MQVTRSLVKRALRMLLSIVSVVLLGGLIAAGIMQLAPGFGVDARELDPRLNRDSVEAIRAARSREGNPLGFYFRYLHRIAHGDFGVSQSLGRPVAELLAERVPATVRTVTGGVLCGWSAGLGLALLACLVRTGVLDAVSGTLSAFFLCIPSSVLALFLVFLSPPERRVSTSVTLAIALVVFPRTYRFSRGILGQVLLMPHLLAARARGLPSGRVLFLHALPAAAPAILALGGVSPSVALSASIPIEAICDWPGIGQLAWQASLERDLPLLLILTLLITVVVVTANSMASLVGELTPGGAAK